MKVKFLNKIKLKARQCIQTSSLYLAPFPLNKCLALPAVQVLAICGTLFTNNHNFLSQSFIRLYFTSPRISVH